MELKDIKTMIEIEEIYNIPKQTLHSRLKRLIESKILVDGRDFRNLGVRMPILLTPYSVYELVHYSDKR